MPKNPQRKAFRKYRPRLGPVLSDSELSSLLLAGACLIRTLPERDGRPVLWGDAKTGRAVDTVLAERFLSEGKLRGRGDGLFSGADQSFEAA